MLASVVFAYRIDGVPRGARNERPLWFLDRAGIAIAEPVDAVAAYVTSEGSRDEWRFGFPSGRTTTVAAGGRLYRAVAAVGGGPLDLQEWLREIASEAGGHVADLPAARTQPDPLGLRGLAGLRDPLEVRGLAELRDPLGLRGAAHGDAATSWPRHQVRDVPLRRVVRSLHEETLRAVERAADRLAVIGGALHAESGEPLWMLRLVGLPDGRTTNLHLEIVPSTFVPPAPLVPFADFRLHRIDRIDDVREEIEALRAFCAPRGAAEALAMLERVVAEIVPPAVPRADPAAAMLRSLERAAVDCARKAAARETEEGLFRSVGQAIEGFRPSPEGGHAVDAAASLMTSAPGCRTAA